MDANTVFVIYDGERPLCPFGVTKAWWRVALWIKDVPIINDTQQ